MLNDTEQITFKSISLWPFVILKLDAETMVINIKNA
jgi:hypothetical protein